MTVDNEFSFQRKLFKRFGTKLQVIVLLQESICRNLLAGEIFLLLKILDAGMRVIMMCVCVCVRRMEGEKVHTFECRQHNCERSVEQNMSVRWSKLGREPSPL